MMLRVLALILVGSASVGLADEIAVTEAPACRLAQPIALTGELVQSIRRPFNVVLGDVTFEQNIKTQQFKSVDQAHLSIEFFDVAIEGTGTGFLGLEVRPSLTLLSGLQRPVVGFATSYGSEQLENLTGTVNRDVPGEVIYTTTIKNSTGKGDAITSLRAKVVGEELTALELTIPVYKEVKLGSLTVMLFTGENETHCLSAAQ